MYGGKCLALLQWIFFQPSKLCTELTVGTFGIRQTKDSDHGYYRWKLIAHARGVCARDVCMSVQDFVDTLLQISSLYLSSDKA